MVGISEAVCTNVQGTLLAESGEGVGKSSGGTETENLFAALLAALGGGLLVPQGELDTLVQGAVQDAQSDVAVDGAGAVGNAAPLPEGVPIASAGGCVSEGGMPSAETADIADAAVASDQTLIDVAAAAAGDETPADVASVAVADEVPTHVADTAGNDQAISSEPIAGATGTAGDQVTIVSVQHADRSAELESPPDPDANSPPESPAQVDSSAQAEKTGSPPAQGREVAAHVSVAGAKAPLPGERPVEPESAMQPVLSSEADPVPSGPGPARIAAHFGGEDNAPMGAGHDAQSGGNDLARGSGEKLFLENLVHSHGPGTHRAANATDNAVWRVSDVGRAHLAEPVIEQTVRGVLLSVRDGASEMRVRMRPEHLGELHLRLVFKENVLSLDVSAQSTVVKSIIESNLGQLRQSLHSNGVEVGKVSVTVDPDVSSGGHFSRETPVFQPSEGEWTGTYRGHREEQQPPLEQWFRGARMRHAVNRLDLVA